MFPPLFKRMCVFPFLLCYYHGWLVPATFVRLSVSAYFHLISSTIVGDIFLPLSTASQCVFPFHEQHNHGWHVPATFDSQSVRIPISQAGQSLLTWCSRHFWLLGCAYFYFISSTIVANMFAPLLIRTRMCVFPFHKQHSHCWHVPATFYFILFFRLSRCVFPFHSKFICSTIIAHIFPSFWLGCAYFHFMCGTITANVFPPCFTLSGCAVAMCVFPLHEHHNHGWHVPATFDSQPVRTSIS